MSKEYWITNSRFKYISVLLIIIWIGFMVLFYLKADEVTKDPCSICSKKMGEQVVCTRNTEFVPVSRIYYPNGTIYTEQKGVYHSLPSQQLNFSE